MNTLCVVAQYGVIFTCSLTEFFNEHFHDIFNNGFLNGNAHGFSNGNAYDFTSPYYFLSIFTIRNLFVFSGSKYEFSFHIARLYTYLLIYANLISPETTLLESAARGSLRGAPIPRGSHLEK